MVNLRRRERSTHESEEHLGMLAWLLASTCACLSLIALTHLVAQELADRLKKEEALRIKHDAKVRSDKDQEQRMRDELGR